MFSSGFAGPTRLAMPSLSLPVQPEPKVKTAATVSGSKPRRLTDLQTRSAGAAFRGRARLPGLGALDAALPPGAYRHL